MLEMFIKYKNLANFLTQWLISLGIFLLIFLLQKSTISPRTLLRSFKIVLIMLEKVLQNGTYMAWMVLRGSKKAFRINGLRGKNVGWESPEGAI